MLNQKNLDTDFTDFTELKEDCSACCFGKTTFAAKHRPYSKQVSVSAVVLWPQAQRAFAEPEEEHRFFWGKRVDKKTELGENQF